MSDVQNMTQIEQELERFRNFPGAVCVDHRNATVYHIARRIIEAIDGRNLLPCDVESLVDATYREDWFVRYFYYDAIAQLIHVGAFFLDGERLSEGPQYVEWLRRTQRVS